MFSNKELRKAKLIDDRITGTYLFISSLIVSIILLYNKKLVLLNQKTILSKQEAKTINIINSSVVLLISLFFQYLNYENKKEDGTSSDLSIIISYFLISAAGLSLYDSIIHPSEEIIQTEDIIT
ncbi:MAG: hypothetical protein PHO63_04055 [Bacilli bacterium]|nr:hypothetical protein [Bacilli bacterium]MDD4809291.1 hypothetical protein [Bacilli bacterium]